ncbi:MAG: hypothetical protein ACXWL2_01730 [Candidatus Chromulinivorax sp.]
MKNHVKTVWIIVFSAFLCQCLYSTLTFSKDSSSSRQTRKQTRHKTAAATKKQQNQSKKYKEAAGIAVYNNNQQEQQQQQQQQNLENWWIAHQEYCQNNPTAQGCQQASNTQNNSNPAT